jgi:hypothetical protein
MDEFRKPYEYTEEKRGFILLFIIMLLTIDILQAPLYIVQGYGSFKHIPVLSISFAVVSILYLLFLLFTAMTCYKMKKNLVAVSKAYLIVRTIFLVSCVIILFINVSNIKDYETAVEYYFRELIAPLAFELVLSIGWYLYFLKSKRCRELVNKQA